MTIDVASKLRAVLGEPMAAAERAALDARVAAMLAARRPNPRRRSPFGRSVVLAAAMFVVLPAVFVVAASILSSEDPFGLASSQEFAAELQAAKDAVALPSGRSWPPHLTVSDASGAYSRGGARSWVELNAVCIWLDDWLAARAARNASRAAAAERAVAGIPSWPSWTSPFWTQSVRDHLSGLIAAVRAGQEGPIRAEIALNCDWLLRE